MPEIVLPTEICGGAGPLDGFAKFTPPTSVALGVVLSVSLLHSVFASFCYLPGGTVPLDRNQHAFRLVGALLAESTSWLVLWYVLCERGSGWRTIAWTPAWKDLPEGFGLFIVGYLATIPPVFVIQAAYRSYAAHYLHAKSLESMLGFGISLLSIAFVLLNPFFEELIVRAYTMSEVMDLGGTRLLAIVVSVSLQMSSTSTRECCGVWRSQPPSPSSPSCEDAADRAVNSGAFCFDALALGRGIF
jgi:membrane protease YdiL (CAAX protease family)